MPGTAFRAPFKVKLLDGTLVQIVNSSGVVTAALSDAPTGSVTIATAKTLTVTDADALLVGGVIVPQTLAVNFHQAGFAAPQFIAPWACKIVSVKERHATAESTAATCTAQVVKTASGTAISGGTNCLSAGINVKGTANTNATGSLSATPADYTLAAGDSLGVKLSASSTELASAIVTVELKRV